MNRQKPEDVLGASSGAARPFTGPEYLESLRDGREVYIYGERVKDVTDASCLSQRRAHHRPALRRAA